MLYRYVLLSEICRAKLQPTLLKNKDCNHQRTKCYWLNNKLIFHEGPSNLVPSQPKFCDGPDLDTLMRSTRMTKYVYKNVD